MRDLASPGYERAIEAARLIAAGANSTAVEVRHLLLGLFAEAEGLALALSRQCGFDAESWCKENPSNFGTVPVEHLSLAADKAIQHARRLAREFLADRMVTTDLLLVGIVETNPDSATELALFGFDMANLRKCVIEPLSEPIPLAELVEPTIVSNATLPMNDASSQSNVDRLLDAVGNRAGEALRVIEDYVRFNRNDLELTQSLKEYRHELSAALTMLPRSSLLQARNTPDDVGTTIEAESEYRRDSIEDVLAANLRRLQESLRSLEEFGKLHDPQFGRRIEQLRYRSYTIEQRLAPVNFLRQKLNDARLCWLASAAQCQNEGIVIRDAIAGGVQIVQLRDKSLSDRQLIDSANLLRRITKETNTLLIINDRPDLALAVNADGVHLGQDDLPISVVRRIIGNKLIGVSTHKIEQLKHALSDKADYVGVGPTFDSKTKSFSELAGLDFVREATNFSIPAFVLGGVALENIDQVIAAGGRRVAVSHAITGADNPRTAAQQLRQRLDTIS